jgi:hypothetical protein
VFFLITLVSLAACLFCKELQIGLEHFPEQIQCNLWLETKMLDVKPLFKA